MKPFYFGDSKNPLLAMYHPPAQAAARDCCAVICPPIAHEHIRTHRALRQLASALATAGCGALRFDYYAVGDSAGKSDEGCMRRWRADIRLAIDEAAAMSGAKRCLLIGVRLGAALAATALTEKGCCTDLVLWDPVVKGSAFLDELTALDARAFPEVRRRAVPGEILGFPYPRTLYDEIQDLDLLKTAIAPVNKIGIVASVAKPDYAELQRRYEAAGARASLVAIKSAGHWDDPAMLDQALVANDGIEAVVANCQGAVK